MLQIGGERRRYDGRQIVADQHGADETFAVLQQAGDDGSVGVAVLGKPQHRAPRRRNQGGFASGEEERHQQEAENRQKNEPIDKRHWPSSFSTRKARSSA